MWGALGVSTVVNVEVIRRLRRRKKKRLRPIYRDGWYIGQFAYGLAVPFCFSLLLPAGQFVGNKVGAFTWEGSKADLMGLQLGIGCTLVGLRWGAKAIVPTLAVLEAWYIVCTTIATGIPDLELATFVAYWALIQVVAGAMASRVLTRMKEVGDAQEDIAGEDYRATVVPRAFAAEQEAAPPLTAEVASLLDHSLPALARAVERVALSAPGVIEAWQALTLQEGTPSFRSLRENFGSEAALRGARGNLLIMGAEVMPLSVLEEAVVESFLHVSLANLSWPDATSESITAIVDMDQAWLRCRAIIRGPFRLVLPSDGLFHSVGALQELAKWFTGRLSLVRVADFGEVIEIRIPRASLDPAK